MGYRDLSGLTRKDRRINAVVHGLPVTVVPQLDGWGKPLGKIRRVTMHWTAGDYQTAYDCYHFCIVYDKITDAAHVLRLLKLTQLGEHAQKANTGNIGVSFCAMRGADTIQTGKFPITQKMLAVSARLVAELCFVYGLTVDNVVDHAHVDREVGFPVGRRWDIGPYMNMLAEPLNRAHSRLRVLHDPLMYGGVLKGGLRQT